MELFTSRAWMSSSRQLHFGQVVSISKIYQKLENNPIFFDSPQKVHLSHTIRRLFEVMVNEDKKKVYNMFRFSDDRNVSLGCCLKVRNLPTDVQPQAEEIAIDRFQTQIRKLVYDENVVMDYVIKSIQLASTCTHSYRDDEFESLLIEAWVKACPNTMKDTVKKLHKGNTWFYKYIEALVSLTESIEHIFEGNSIYCIKVLHIISNIVRGGCKELNLLLINILCKFAIFETNDMNKHVPDAILTQTFSELFDNTDSTVRNKLYITLRRYKNNNLYRIVSNVVNKNESLKEAWTHFIRHGGLKKISNTTLKEQLQHTMDFVYCHKCIDHDEELRKSLSNNFDLIDIDSLLDPESDTEPAYKKAKLDINEIEEIISRLEADTDLLSGIKENVFSSEYKNRIKTVCNKLKNIID